MNNKLEVIGIDHGLSLIHISFEDKSFIVKPPISISSVTKQSGELRKRMKEPAWLVPDCFVTEDIDTVSYTHLDVYKRQPV